MVSPHLPDPSKKATKDIVASFGFIWRLPCALRAAIWIIFVVVPIVSVWRYFQSPLSLRLLDMTWTQCFGLTLFFSFYSLRLWAKSVLGASFTYEIATPESLITLDPYALLVHPSYTGTLVSYPLGLSLVCGFRFSFAMTVFVLVSALLIATRVREEEDMLRSHFGSAAFDSYVSSRYRLFPFVY